MIHASAEAFLGFVRSLLEDSGVARAVDIDYENAPRLRTLSVVVDQAVHSRDPDTGREIHLAPGDALTFVVQGYAIGATAQEVLPMLDLARIQNT